MTDANKTLIAALLDRTGSMESSKDATEKGFDELINGQRSEPGEAVVTLAQFDMHPGAPVPEFVYYNKPIAQVPALELIPRGMTPLLDAVGGFVTQIGEDLAQLPEDDRPATVICFIMTDGHENASREWTWERVQRLIKQQTDEWSWKFMFLGANIDAVEVGARMGFARGQSMTYNAADDQAVMDSYAVASAGMSNIRGAAPGAAAAADFTDDDRARAMGKRGRK